MIEFLDLRELNKPYEEQFKREFEKFLNDGYYILGEGVERFEVEFAEYCGVKYCIGVGNGLDALTLIFRAYKELGVLKDGDEVIVPANTYIASALAITENNLIPVFVDPNPDTFLITAEEVKNHITKNTKAILAVHLYGQLVDVELLRQMVGDVLIVEDAAQAHGTINKNGIKAGSLGDAAGFSFYPTKNLGALGDGGAVTTNNDELAEVINMLRNYGSVKKNIYNYKGINSRLDEIQSRFLSIKLKDLDKQNRKRQDIASVYIKEIKNRDVNLPFWDSSGNHVFHQFVIKTQQREKLRSYLYENGIETAIHYPFAIHKQKAFKEYLSLDLPITEKLHKEVLSLPISSSLRETDIELIIEKIRLYV